ncbi:MAG: NUDIX hydrolase [Pseudomonadota bacterium]
MKQSYQASEVDLADEVNRIETMINSPKVRDLRNRNRESNGYVRPKNASTMILVDGSANNPKVLMGKRNKAVKFMPGALVFPGGSVDRQDGSIDVSGELTENTRQRLLDNMRGRATKRGARALALAAVREVAEESGLLIGRKGAFSYADNDWQDFRENNVIPSLSGLKLFSRAITPPGLARRFDTWFFIAKASEVAHIPENGFDPDGELEELQWVSPEKAITENTREITRVMLVELIRRLRSDPEFSDDYPAPYYYTVNNRFERKLI